MTTYQKIKTFTQKRQLEPYWYLITLILMIASIVFLYHLATGQTPNRVAITLGEFAIYWYGISIITGIALGAYVVSRLANARGITIFDLEVPESSQQASLNILKLPKKITKSFTKQKITTMGQLLL